MKAYYIRFWKNFSNTFELAWADNSADRKWLVSAGFERCTRKYAEMKARNERYAREHDQAFSGYGDTSIAPAAYWKLNERRYNADTNGDRDRGPDPEVWLYDNCELKGVIWE